jgi:hypothetical protein
MAGRPAEAQHVRTTFESECSSARTLVAAILAIPAKVKPSPSPGLHPKHAQQVVELAFMAVVASWEEFLEDSLVRYVAGAKTASGYRPTPKFGLASGIPHAYQILSQDTKFDPQRDYLKVTDPNWVRSTAAFIFSAHPYTHLQPKTDLIKHASAIRNRIAHSSEKCRTDFKTTALYFLQPASGKLTQGYSPGKLLLSKVQRHFGQTAVQKGHTVFEAYLQMYESLVL